MKLCRDESLSRERVMGLSLHMVNGIVNFDIAHTRSMDSKKGQKTFKEIL